MTAEPALTAPEYQELARFRRALRTFLHFSEQAAHEAGLTPAQHQLLLAVHGRADGGPTTTTALAEALQLRLHSTVQLAARAEANGLVTRRADPADHRRVLIELTEVGLTKLAALSVLHRAELRRFRDEIGLA